MPPCGQKLHFKWASHIYHIFGVIRCRCRLKVFNCLTGDTGGPSLVHVPMFKNHWWQALDKPPWPMTPVCHYSHCWRLEKMESERGEPWYRVNDGTYRRLLHRQWTAAVARRAKKNVHRVWRTYDPPEPVAHTTLWDAIIPSFRYVSFAWVVSSAISSAVTSSSHPGHFWLLLHMIPPHLETRRRTVCAASSPAFNELPCLYIMIHSNYVYDPARYPSFNRWFHFSPCSVIVKVLTSYFV